MGNQLKRSSGNQPYEKSYESPQSQRESSLIRFKKAPQTTANVTRCLPGFSGANRFCILPNEQLALVYGSGGSKGRNEVLLESLNFVDIDTKFVLVNLKTGERSVIETEYSKKTEHDYCGIYAVMRASKTFVLSLQLDQIIGRMYIISYLFSYQKMLLIDENYLGTDSRYLLNWANIQENEVGNIYCLVKLSTTETETTFHLIKIDIDDNGKIWSNILVKNGTFSGRWYAPFVHSEAFYWLPKDALHAGRLKTLLEMSLNESNSGDVQVVTKQIDVDVSKQIDEDVKAQQPHNQILVSGCQNPVVVGDNIFYYVFTNENNVGYLLHLDFESKCWQTLLLDLKDGAIFSWGASLRAASRSCLFLNGILSNFDRGYIYRIEIDGLRPKKVKEKLNVGDQGSTGSHMKLHKKLSSDRHEQSEANQKWTVPKQYDQLEQLGFGSFGVVYKCWDGVAKKMFVAKYTHIESDQNINIAQNEIKQLEKCNHPKIVKYFGCKTEQNNITIFMEYMPCGSLYRFINENGPITESISIDYIAQVLDGLTYIHGKGIVHSDLKCDNLLIDEHGNIKICDFGIAIQKRLNSLNYSYFLSTVKCVGTPYWIAPEVMKQTNGCSRASDVWSLGCTIVEMLTGHPPYSQMITAEFMKNFYGNSLSYDPEDLIPEASSKMKQFLAKLLQIEIDLRLHTGADATQWFRVNFKS